ncbi:hypothetical protein Ocin01_12525 [Orchesella cincta]|uniref:Uncharacterized protein n=1 Tax=Orchesella cincta TaxID=48709 RepID=A0A1D2MMR3_ORCCI|nr:hypothetical protein Ocin01_12525 [Orchesella cincta]
MKVFQIFAFVAAIIAVAMANVAPAEQAPAKNPKDCAEGTQACAAGCCPI